MHKTVKCHRVLGALLILPFLGWAATAVIFFLKPGYGPAYAALSVKSYPLSQQPTLSWQADWLEVRQLRTTLGHHLLVRSPAGWQHLRGDGSPWSPTQAEVVALLKDAIASDEARYGQLAESTTAGGTTTSGVHISLNWQTLGLYQKGKDTARIDLAYKIHYLQWTGQKQLDMVLGMLGLLALVLMAGTGLRLLLGSRVRS